MTSMYFSIAEQTIVFLKAILFGAAVGVYYDLLRAVRRQGRLRGLAVAALDGLFWLALIIAFALFVLLAADGNGRSYVLLGLAGGMTLYFLTLSAAVLLAVGFLLGLLARLLGGLRKLAALPFGLLHHLPVQKYFRKINPKIFKKTLPFFKK